MSGSEDIDCGELCHKQKMRLISAEIKGEN